MYIDQHFPFFRILLNYKFGPDSVQRIILGY